MTHVEHRPRITVENGDGHKPAASRSIPELLKELRNETTLLLRQEVALAKTEMSEKASKFGRNAGYIAVGGAVLFAGFLFILAAINQALVVALTAMEVSASITIWLAPAIVGLVVAAIGAGMAMKGKKTLSEESPAPTRTVASMQENKEWIKHKVK